MNPPKKMYKKKKKTKKKTILKFYTELVFHRAELWSRGPDKHNYVHPLKMIISLSLYS